MKNFLKSVISILVVVVLTIVILPIQNANAATKKATVKTIKVDSNKAKSSTTYADYLRYASSRSYNMTLRNTTEGDTVLSYTTDGKEYTDVDMVELVKEKFGSDKSDISFYNINCLDDLFIITGHIERNADEKSNFYLATKDGKDFTFGALECSIGGGFDIGYIYKVGSTYIYTVAEGEDMGGGLNQKAGYYTSKDLNNWDFVNTPKNGKCSALGHMWKLETVTDSGMIIAANKDNGVGWKPYQLYYTKDFKTYHKIKNGISYADAGAGVEAIFEDKTFLRTERTWDKKGNFTGINFLTSTNYTKWNSVLNYKENKYSSPTNRFYWQSTDRNWMVAVERKKNNSLFIYSNKNKAFTEYSTSLKASLFGPAVYEDNNNYTYTIYDSKYVLVSHDGYKTFYKIKTPLSNIQSIYVNDSVLSIQGKSNYYMTTKDIKAAIKNSK